ncbi:protein-tyrosine phosphatase family protein [Roseibium sp.]|uniref:protein-tyrosine phosphatase family protein n=1 Tax=Roseibium sp. TaxID=1936156 RepID=UPI003B507BCC
MLPSLYEIPVPCSGRLFIMPKPSSDWLRDDLIKLKEFGVSRLVSMLTLEEINELSLEDEPNISRELGLEFTNLSVPDRTVPEAWQVSELVASIQKDLGRDLGVAIHCRAGIGRSGLTAACVLIAEGMDAGAAMDLVTEARGVNTPDTQEQAEFVRKFRLQGAGSG